MSILLAIWTFQLINNYIWLKLDTFPLLWDSGTYYLESLVLFDSLRNFDSSHLANVLRVGDQYPPFVPFLMAVSYGVFGRSEDVGVFVANSLFLAVMIFSVYGIAKILADRKTAFLAAFLVTMYPMVFGHSRIVAYDLPVAAFACLGILIFLKTDNFRNTGYSLLFGAVCGFGLLTKFSFLLFVGSALLFRFSRNCYKTVNYIVKNQFRFLRQNHGKQFINLMTAAFITIFLIAGWYSINFHRFLYALFVYPRTCSEVCPPVFTLASFVYYLFSLMNYQTSFFLFVVFVLGLFFFARPEVRNKSFLYGWMLFVYIGCTLVRYKSPRYTLPYLPAIAIISAIGLMRIPHKSIRIAVVSFVVVCSILQYFACSYGFTFLPESISIDLPSRFAEISRVKAVLLFDQKGGENPLEQHVQLRKEDWRTREVLEELIKFSEGKQDHHLNVFIIPDDPRIHCPLVSLAYAEKLPFTFTVASCEHIAVSERDVVITKDTRWMVPPYFMDKINQSVRWFEEHRGDYGIAHALRLPDGSDLLIYKKN